MKEHVVQVRGQVALVQHVQVTIMTARRKVEDVWKKETNALQQLFNCLRTKLHNKKTQYLFLLRHHHLQTALLCGRSLCRLTWTDDALKR